MDVFLPSGELEVGVVTSGGNMISANCRAAVSITMSPAVPSSAG